MLACSAPPSAVKVPVPRALLLPTTRAPELSSTPPVNVLLPPSTHVPAPVLTNDSEVAVPLEITPLTALLLVLLPVRVSTVLPAAALTLPPKINDLMLSDASLENAVGGVGPLDDERSIDRFGVRH